MGSLTTHVLDTANGRPAAGVPVDLYRLSPTPVSLASALTNGGGRCDAPLLQGDQLTVGQYCLTFRVAGYFRASGLILPEPPFLDRIDILFAVSAAHEHYHVPLLVSPWSYSTYRGS
jgi:5-hydroxyisourate hydrolase